MNRTLRRVLLASLALNLALAASLVWLTWPPAASEPASQPPRPMLRSEALRGALRPERGPVVDQVMASHRERMHARIETMSQARNEVYEAILAEPFERQRLDAAFAQLRQAEGDTAWEAHNLLADLVEQAEPDERQHLAQLIKTRRELRGPRLDRRHPR